MSLPSKANQHLQRVRMLPACQDESARCRMSSAKMVDEMTGFIIVTALMLLDEVEELLNKEPTKVDTIINLNAISYCYENLEEDCTIIVLTDKSEITATQSLDEIIQRIRRSTAINVFAQ
jgi:hypothetical protein